MSKILLLAIFLFFFSPLSSPSYGRSVNSWSKTSAGNITWSNVTLVVSSNITVGQYQYIKIYNSTIFFNSSGHPVSINLLPRSSMLLYNSTLEGMYGTSFSIDASYSTVDVINSTIINSGINETVPGMELYESYLTVNGSVFMHDTVPLYIFVMHAFRITQSMFYYDNLSGIHVEESDHGNIANNIFKYSYYEGIVIDHSENIVIAANSFWHTKDDSISVKDSSNVTLYSNRIYYTGTGIYTYKAYNESMLFNTVYDAYTAIYTGYSDSVWIYGSYIYSTAYGIEINVSTNISLYNSYFYSMESYPLYITDTYSVYVKGITVGDSAGSYLYDSNSMVYISNTYIPYRSCYIVNDGVIEEEKELYIHVYSYNGTAIDNAYVTVSTGRNIIIRAGGVHGLYTFYSIPWAIYNSYSLFYPRFSISVIWGKWVFIPESALNLNITDSFNFTNAYIYSYTWFVNEPVYSGTRYPIKVLLKTNIANISAISFSAANAEITAAYNHTLILSFYAPFAFYRGESAVMIVPANAMHNPIILNITVYAPVYIYVEYMDSGIILFTSVVIAASKIRRRFR